MPEIPTEAVQAGAEVLERRGFTDKTFAGYARAVLEVAAPILAEQFRRDAALALRAVAESRELRHRFVDRHPVLHEGVTVSSALLAVADEIEGETHDPR